MASGYCTGQHRIEHFYHKVYWTALVYITGLEGGVNELVHLKCLERSLAYRRGSIYLSLPSSSSSPSPSLFLYLSSFSSPLQNGGWVYCKRGRLLHFLVTSLCTNVLFPVQSCKLPCDRIFISKERHHHTIAMSKGRRANQPVLNLNSAI